MTPTKDVDDLTFDENNKRDDDKIGPIEEDNDEDNVTFTTLRKSSAFTLERFSSKN